VSWGRLTKEAALLRSRREPTRNGPLANDLDPRPCRAKGRAAIQPTLTKLAESDVHRGHLSTDCPNSLLGPKTQRGGPFGPPAGAHTKWAPTPTAKTCRPAQQQDGPVSSQPLRIWLIQVRTGASRPVPAQTVSWGRLTTEAPLLCRRRGPTQSERPRRRRGYAVLPSRRTSRVPAGLPEGG